MDKDFALDTYDRPEVSGCYAVARQKAPGDSEAQQPKGLAPMNAPLTDTAGIRQTLRALRATGWLLDSVYDGEEIIPVSTESAAVEAITAVDCARLTVVRHRELGSVYFVLGNSPEEVICDHSVNLSPELDALLDRWERS